jgi:hypothetical protein
VAHQPPERKSEPKRAVMVVLTTVTFFLLMVVIFIRQGLRNGRSAGILLHGGVTPLLVAETDLDNRVPAGHAAFLNSSPYTRFGYSSTFRSYPSWHPPPPKPFSTFAC